MKPGSVPPAGGPGERIFGGRLISGASALTWARRTLKVLACGLALSAWLLGDVFGLWGPRDGAGFWVSFVMWGSVMACGATCIAIQAMQDVRESRHGYTTSYRGRRELPQVDPATRRIVRAPGAPYITAPRKPRSAAA